MKFKVGDQVIVKPGIDGFYREGIITKIIDDSVWFHPTGDEKMARYTEWYDLELSHKYKNIEKVNNYLGVK